MDPERTEELELDLEELSAALRINEILEENAALREIVGMLYTQQSLLERRMSSLEGEPVVTEQVQTHILPGGQLQHSRWQPAVPQKVVDVLNKITQPRAL